jgi:hypothetical protein
MGTPLKIEVGSHLAGSQKLQAGCLENADQKHAEEKDFPKTHATLL